MYSIKQKLDLPFFLGLSNFSNQVMPARAKKGFTFVPLFKSLIKNKFISRAPEGLTGVTVSTGILPGTHLRLNLKENRYNNMHLPTISDGFIHMKTKKNWRGLYIK
jgi:hypothetical protein